MFSPLQFTNYEPIYHCTCPLGGRGGGNICFVLIFIRQVVPHGFSLGLPALKTPVEVLGDLPLGLHQGSREGRGEFDPDFYSVNVIDGVSFG